MSEDKDGLAEREERSRRRDRKNRELRENQLVGSTSMIPAPGLAAIVGQRKISHSEASKKVWAYIKRNSLQEDENDKSRITTDEKLRRVVGEKKDEVSIAELIWCIGENLQPDAAEDAYRRKAREERAKRAEDERKRMADQQSDRIARAKRRREEEEERRCRKQDEHREKVQAEYRRMFG